MEKMCEAKNETKCLRDKKSIGLTIRDSSNSKSSYYDYLDLFCAWTTEATVRIKIATTTSPRCGYLF